MTLRQLFADDTLPNLELKGITYDSRRVEAGFVFVAIPGVPLPSRKPFDGHDYITQAVQKGAVAVVGSRSSAELGEGARGAPYIQVEDARAALADLSAAFWGHPASRLELLGITGSKGKTTVTVLAHHLLQTAQPPVGRLSTVGIKIGEEELLLPGHFTTPEAPQVQETLHKFAEAGCSQAVLEVSSHALQLERVRGIEYAVGVFTNLFEDHLDLHKTMENYFEQKRKLLGRSRFAVVNADNPWTQSLTGHGNTWSYGREGDWRLENLRETQSGLRFQVVSPVGEFPVEVPMVGAFNAYNALAAMAACTKLGLEVSHLQSGLRSFPGVPGRMQLIQSEPFRVIVDFAHTGASLEAALHTLRPTTKGRLMVVIGAAGNQDPSRRTGIGRVAGELADFAVFTEEDHRTESLEAILQTMSEAHGDPKRHTLIGDRTEAIAWATQHAQEGDTVLFSGKGHERTLERGSETIPWNEVEVVRKALGGARER